VPNNTPAIFADLNFSAFVLYSSISARRSCISFLVAEQPPKEQTV